MEIDCAEVIKEMDQVQKKPIHGAMVSGSFTDLIIDSTKKHKAHRVNNYNNDVLSICGADAADHRSGSKTKLLHGPPNCTGRIYKMKE